MTAALVFGVGSRDETYRTCEVTHLIEHLVMGTITRSSLDCNATVTPTATAFHATGEPAAVCAFLSEVCAGIRELPVDRREHEARVIGIEASGVCHPAIASYLGHRYGAQSYGLADSPPDHAATLTDEHVVAHGQRYFHRDNLVLVMSGEPPSDLVLDLPSGSELRREAPAPFDRFPASLQIESDEVCLVAEIAAQGDSEALLGGVLGERVREELRVGRGIVYDTEVHFELISDVRAVVAVVSDAARGSHEDVARFLWGELHDIAARGPSGDSWTQALGLWRADQSDPRNVSSRLLERAEDLLLGRPPRTEPVTDECLAEEVQAAAREALETSLLMVPEDTDLPDLGLPDLDRKPVRPAVTYGDRLFRRKLLRLTPWDLSARVGSDGLTLHAGGTTLSAPWIDVVGVGVDGTIRAFMTRSGVGGLLDGNDYRGGADLLRIIDTHAAERCYPFDVDNLLDEPA